MKVTVKKSTLVKPAQETPTDSIWLSSLDLQMPATYHTRSVYFFRPDGSADFFDAAVLKAALSQALVNFFPFAGRLRRDENGRIEINCNNEGVVFLEAECDAAIDDLGGFHPRDDVPLVAKVDYSQGISTFPLSLIQLTRFKCGGVSIGVANEHHVADGIAGLHYINSWSDIARGVSITDLEPPFLDRRLLSARNPPQPQFPHIEHQPPPSLKTPLDITEASFRTFALTRDQINTLKIKCNLDAAAGEAKTTYTTYEAVAGHVWRSVCRARRLPHDQESKLQLPVDSRPRLRPPLPPRFFANGVFYTTALATYGEMETKPLSFAVGRLHEAVARMDDEYLRSALDYIELQLPKPSQSVVRSGNNVKCPNFGITSWTRLPFYEADFGWGKPIHAGPGEALFEGKSFLFPNSGNEGGLLLSISLLKPHMELFQKLIYEI